MSWLNCSQVSRPEILRNAWHSSKIKPDSQEEQHEDFPQRWKERRKSVRLLNVLYVASSITQMLLRCRHCMPMAYVTSMSKKHVKKGYRFFRKREEIPATGYNIGRTSYLGCAKNTNTLTTRSPDALSGVEVVRSQNATQVLNIPMWRVCCRQPSTPDFPPSCPKSVQALWTRAFKFWRLGNSICGAMPFVK